MLQQYLPLAVLKRIPSRILHWLTMLQQYLPLAVLKLAILRLIYSRSAVATVLTACGIETSRYFLVKITLFRRVATVLTACGIETRLNFPVSPLNVYVATVLTACGIETQKIQFC